MDRKWIAWIANVVPCCRLSSSCLLSCLSIVVLLSSWIPILYPVVVYRPLGCSRACPLPSGLRSSIWLRSWNLLNHSHGLKEPAAMKRQAAMKKRQAAATKKRPAAISSSSSSSSMKERPTVVKKRPAAISREQTSEKANSREEKANSREDKVYVRDQTSEAMIVELATRGLAAQDATLGGDIHTAPRKPVPPDCECCFEGAYACAACCAWYPTLWLSLLSRSGPKGMCSELQYGNTISYCTSPKPFSPPHPHKTNL